jgi:serine/threonine protein kinase
MPSIYSACPRCRTTFRSGGFARCPNDGQAVVTGAGDLLVGTVLAGRYRVDEVLGQGGIGRVYRCRHVRISREYAVKVPFGELAAQAKVRRRIRNEAEAAGRLQHPNVVGIVDVGETAEGLLYLAMDLADGESLEAVIARGPIGQARALRMLTQMLEGLAHAHERGVIHRDLKPDNVIVGRDRHGRDRLRIVDFGLAVIGEHGSRFTTQGMVMGTPAYMAPEQCTGDELDARTDLFALGLVLYQMLAGRLPFDGAAVEIARDNLDTPLPALRDRAPDVAVDPRLEGLVRWLTEKRPAHRPANARAALRACSAIVL